MKNFLIIASPRTGSTLLVKCLSPHCLIEPWTHPQNYGWKAVDGYARADEFFGQITQQLSVEVGCEHPIGARVHTKQLENMSVSSYTNLFSMIESGVFLRRKNLTEQVVSDVIMRTEEKPARLDVDSLIARAEVNVSEYFKWLLEAKKHFRVKEIWYEDLDGNILNVANNVRSFIGLPQKEVITHGMRKERSEDRYRKQISNYDEIVRRMGDVYGVPFGCYGNRWDK
jgi:hypothetical protein